MLSCKKCLLSNRPSLEPAQQSRLWHLQHRQLPTGPDPLQRQPQGHELRRAGHRRHQHVAVGQAGAGLTGRRGGGIGIGTAPDPDRAVAAEAVQCPGIARGAHLAEQKGAPLLGSACANTVPGQERVKYGEQHCASSTESYTTLQCRFQFLDGRAEENGLPPLRLA